ncbi:imelysin family protein [Dyadobacter sp. CY323]|uniref:imelysin family protein n=1 Tax=Dyadobacter sp. CY323 TaxID=2907302 RepID=UPI001F1B57E4|nr:imelysin family protein [Dyadobacter sp. CY323]MCE6991448.1 hypothetical protein [Dyadobacter sp. CY323]
MKYFLSFLFVLLLSSCKEKQPEPISVSDRELALQGIGNSAIMRSFLDLQNSVNALNEFAISYQHDSTNTQKLLRLRREWLNAAVAWKMSAIFLQGKLGADTASSDLYARANAAAIDAIILSNVPRFDKTYMQSLPETSTGLAAIEYLIYGTNNGNAEPVISAFSAVGSRRGAFLHALCLDLKRQSDQLLYQWSISGGGYLNQFTASSGAGRNSSIGVLTDNMITTISKIKEDKLGTPLGINQAAARPDLVESKYSGESATLIRAELQSVQQIFSGKRTLGVGSPALYWLLDEAGARSGDTALSAAIEAQFADISQRLDLITIPLEQEILNNPKQLGQVYESLEKLQKLIENEVVAGLYFQD